MLPVGVGGLRPCSVRCASPLFTQTYLIVMSNWRRKSAPRLPLANHVTSLDNQYAGDCITQPHNASWRCLEFNYGTSFMPSGLISLQFHVHHILCSSESETSDTLKTCFLLCCELLHCDNDVLPIKRSGLRKCCHPHAAANQQCWAAHSLWSCCGVRVISHSEFPSGLGFSAGLFYPPGEHCGRFHINKHTQAVIIRMNSPVCLTLCSTHVHTDIRKRSQSDLLSATRADIFLLWASKVGRGGKCTMWDLIL